MIATRILLGCIVSLLSSLPLKAQLLDRNPPYRIQCSDVLELRFRFTPEFNQQLTVQPDGRVAVAGVGDTLVVGLTIVQVRDQLTSLFQKRLKDPEVEVILKEFQKPFVFIGGEVMTPGRVELRGSLTAIEAISLAGGFKPSSKHSQVLLLRKIAPDRAETRLLNLKDLIANNKLEEDWALQSGDFLYVPQNKISKVERIVHLGDFGIYYNPAVK